MRRLPAYRTDDNAAEASWAWAREEIAAYTCLGAKAKGREKVGAFFGGLAERPAAVRSRCGTKWQALAEALPAAPLAQPADGHHGGPTRASV